MFILLAPSEEKISPSKHCKIDEFCDFYSKYTFDLQFSFLEHKKLFLAYLDALKNNPNDIFATKNPQKILNNLGLELAPALIRYSGVAYNAFDFCSLNTAEQNYALERIIIFSNLFGAVLAKDKIPFYKLKQGIKPPNFQEPLDRFFCTHQSKLLDDFLDKNNCDFAVDLRAKAYETFYKIKHPKATFTILKNGKSVSHFSKHYRGLIARFCVQQCAASPVTNLEHFLDILQANFCATGEFIDKNLHIIIDFKD